MNQDFKPDYHDLARRHANLRLATDVERMKAVIEAYEQQQEASCASKYEPVTMSKPIKQAFIILKENLSTYQTMLNTVRGYEPLSVVNVVVTNLDDDIAELERLISEADAQRTNDAPFESAGVQNRTSGWEFDY